MPSPTGLMKQAASASSDEGTESTASALSTDAASSRRRARRRTEFVTLDREMELVSLATNDQGQRVRNVPRRQWKNRTKKRKVLEKEDVKEHAIEAGEVRKRLRGSRVAFEDEVVGDSMIFDPSVEKEFQYPSGVEVENVNWRGEGSQEEEHGHDDEIEDDDEDLEENEDDLNDNEEGLDLRVGKELSRTRDESEPEDGMTQHTSLHGSADKRPRPETVKAGKSNSSRVMYRLKNFKSQRLVSKQGMALGAHARGQHKMAIQTLGEVAAVAPLAPQVYSTLGLVYENMLRDQERSPSKQNSLEVKETEKGHEIEGEEGGDGSELEGVDGTVESKLDLAKKAYGSFHIAAVMCKKDFTLWVRSADAALSIADLYSTMHHSDINSSRATECMAERKRWLIEARNDYHIADNLQPPGISIPAKLASVQMELGNLSEALTILTDMKNNARARKEMERSYGAWLLYSDLMLRIGYECNQWNLGIQTNDNYMFRRWLRKYSHSFNWRERRLQALCLAFEAAAGSSACTRLVDWLRDRAAKAGRGKNERWQLDSYESEERSEIGGDDEGKEDEEGNLSSLETLKKQFDRERESLLSRNKAELGEFDSQNIEMNIEQSSKLEQERVTERLYLLKKHRSSVLLLVGENQQKKEAATQKKSEGNDCSSNSVSPLPISASLAKVVEIAGSLMKLFIDFSLYGGCSLVGQALSVYLKERVSKRDHRMRDNVLELHAPNPLQIRPLFDQVDYSDGSDSENSILDFLSDDEDINEASAEILQSMRKGVLPPEIQVLCGIGLFGEGGKKFSAQRALLAISELNVSEQIDEEGEGASIEGAIEEDSQALDQAWPLFYQSAVRPLNQEFAYVLLAEIIEKEDESKKSQMLDMINFFQGYINHLEDEGYIDSVVRADASVTGDKLAERKRHYVKILCASFNLQLTRAIDEMSKPPFPFRTALDAFDFFIRFKDILWSGPSTDRTLQTFEIKILKGFVRLFAALVSCIAKTTSDFGKNKVIVIKMSRVLSILFQLSLGEKEGEQKVDAGMWSNIPIPSDWQSTIEKMLSRRVFNLCVSCAVPSALSYSLGWGEDDFSLNKLMVGTGLNFSGINVDERSPAISGVLPIDIESDIEGQWTLIQNCLEASSSFDLKNELSKVKESKWYSSVAEKRKDGEENTPLWGEDEGIKLLLQYSRLCLLMTSAPTKGDVDPQFLRNALSIVLPIAQFSVGQILWKSNVGLNNISDMERREWKYFTQARGAVNVKRDGALSSSAPRQRKQTTIPRIQRKGTASNFSPGARGSPYDSLRPKNSTFLDITSLLSSSALFREWSSRSDDDQGNLQAATTLITEAAMEAMERLDDSLEQLRNASTFSATQKACLHVASALLDVSSQSECRNPFLCVQHAAIFAAQGPKLGKSDELFKRPLPLDADFSPLHAVVVLGRADCLRALHFTEEAQFLCSFVARQRFQRRSESANAASSSSISKWEAVGAYAYVVGVAIEATLSSRLELSGMTLNTSGWDSDVLEELKRCREDAHRLAGRTATNESQSETEVVAESFSNNSPFVGQNPQDDDIEGEALEIVEV